MKALGVAGLLLALVASEAAVADSWDNFGRRHDRDGVRHGHFDDHPGRGLARGHDRQRSQVNIIVAPQANRWAPRWNDHYDYRDYRHERRHDSVVFNSSLGFIAGTVFGLAVAPQAGDHHYVREYREPYTVIDRDEGGMSISLFKDRFGACYERETDYNGRVIQRRVADYNCDF